jgi:hypothetical protein
LVLRRHLDEAIGVPISDRTNPATLRRPEAHSICADSSVHLLGERQKANERERLPELLVLDPMNPRLPELPLQEARQKRKGEYSVPRAAEETSTQLPAASEDWVARLQRGRDVAGGTVRARLPCNGVANRTLRGSLVDRLGRAGTHRRDDQQRGGCGQYKHAAGH